VPAQAVPPPDQPIWAIGPDGAPEQAGYATPPADWVPVVGEPTVRPTPRDWLLEIAAAVAVAVVLTGIGVGLAFVWEAISPRTVLEMSADGAVYTEPNPEGYVAGESVYLLMTAGLGIISPLVVWLVVRRRRGPILLAGLTVGSVAGATLMAWVGQRIGLEEYRQLLAGAPVGTRFEIPVKVYSAIIDVAGFRIQGAVLVQAMIAVAIYTFLAGFYPTASLRPERAVVHWVPPVGPEGPMGPGPGGLPDPADPPPAAPAAAAQPAGPYPGIEKAA
jgi:hypothetical protein